jgi:hypothetical protein
MRTENAKIDILFMQLCLDNLDLDQPSAIRLDHDLPYARKEFAPLGTAIETAPQGDIP